MLSVTFPIKRNYNWEKKLYQEVILRKKSEIVVVGQEIAISASLLTSLSCKTFVVIERMMTRNPHLCVNAFTRLGETGGLVVLVIN